MTEKNGGYVIVREYIAAAKVAPGHLIPAAMCYLRHAHRDQDDNCWTVHPHAAWRYKTLEDAFAMVLVMARPDRPQPRIIPWSWRGKRAIKEWVPREP